jgi:WD40 repeat protein/tRNA A-37 threonylcarbamoyl transferase component Bud32
VATRDDDPGSESASSAALPETPSISDPFAALLLEKYGGRALADASLFELPRRLGKYELVEEIGRGGMGVIFRAREPDLDRSVAIKMILSGERASEAEIHRFREEAMAAASLDHPGIVQVYDSGRLAGRWFLAMKLLEGGSLAGRLAGYLGKPREAALLIESLAQAAHYAHQRGIIHRDLKPANILFDADGRPCITDFGLSKRLDAGVPKTRSGLVVGTLAYMAPEQADGSRRALTTAVDIYGLGAILYELLTGSPPFAGDGSAELLGSILHQDPEAPSRLRRDLPRDLDTICLKCLQKEPDRRYRSAGELADDLARFGRGEPIAARPCGWIARSLKWAKRRPAAATLVGFAALVVLSAPLALLWHEAGLRERAEAAAAAAARGRRYVYAARLNLAFEAWRRELYGRSRALLESLRPQAGDEDLRCFGWRHLRRLVNPERLSIEAHEERIDALRFSDGGSRLISASTAGDVRVWDTRQGALLEEYDGGGSRIYFPCISADGRFIAQIRIRAPDRSWGIRVIERRGGGAAPAWRERVLASGRGFRAAGFSPDAAELVAADMDGELFRWRTSGWSEERVAFAGRPAFDLAYSPGGERIALCLDLGKVVVLDAATLAPAAELASDAGYTSHMSFSPDGALLAVMRRDGPIELLETAGWRRVGLIDAAGKSGVVFSPDGGVLAVAVSDDGEVPAIELWSVQTPSLSRRLVSHDAGVSSIAFHRDSGTVAAADQDGVIKLWSLADAPEPARVEVAGDAYLGVASDGGTVVARRGDFTLDVFSIEPRGSSLVLAPRGVVRWDLERSAGALSADGRRAAIAVRDGPVRLYRIEVAPPAPRALEEAAIETGGDAVVCLSFAPDGDAVFAASADGRVCRWRRLGGGGGARWERDAALEAGAGDASDLVVSPDGATLAIGASRSPRVSLWDLASGRRLAVLEAHREWVIAFAYSADSRRLATGALDAAVCLWDLEAIRKRALAGGESPAKPEPLRVLGGHARAVASLAFLEGGGLLASGSDDRTVKLWDLVTGEERATLAAYRLHVNALAVARGGELLISAGGRRRTFGDVVLWQSGRGTTSDELSRE